MGQFRWYWVVLIIGYSYSSSAQKFKEKISFITGYEANYTGNNLNVFAGLKLQKHNLAIGTNYNVSDGFANNPVLGIILNYGYTVVENEKWMATIGVDYRRQKPISIVNIQSIMLTQSLTVMLHKNIGLQNRIGYGPVAERSASSGSFSQSNNLSGQFSLGCVFRL